MLSADVPQTIHLEKGRIEMIKAIVLSVFAMCMTGCLAGDLDLEPAGEATYEVTASEQDGEGAEAIPASEDSFEPLCEPGPPSNWCQNVEGASCSSPGTRRRCYIPNYCEWMLCTCTGGVWADCM
jgi:hypothetical protein